ncbi:MAG TPA: glycosyltransferase family 39 protein [Gemmataceae bacterium]|jgi:hypothetical protein
MRGQSTDSLTLTDGCASHNLGQLETEGRNGLTPQQATKIAWLLLALIVLTTAGLRVRLLPISLERDEGEYAYIAQLILQGEIPFTQAHTMKYPGVPYVYAAFLAVFGQTDVAIHLGLMLINALSVVLIFLLGKRLFNPVIGLMAASSFAFLSLSRSTLGFTANAEHFVLLPLLGATLLLLLALEERRLLCLLASGFLYGVAVLMKQHAAVFAGFAGVYLLIQSLRRDGRSIQRLLSHLLIFSAAMVFPVALLWLSLGIKGAFAPFWFWTFTYPRYYLSMSSWQGGRDSLFRMGGWQISSSIGLYSLALVGLAASILNRSLRPRCLFLLLFTGFSILSVCPGLHFRSHYFLLLAPAVSLLAAVASTALGQLCRRIAPPDRIAVLVTLVALITDFGKQLPYFFLLSPDEITTLTYPTHFNAMKALGVYIRDHTQPEDRIAVLGSEPEVYFYARRQAATKYIYTYPLMEPQRYSLQMQEEMIAEMEQCRPRYIALVRFADSWFSCVDPDAPQLIMQWPLKFVAANYRRVAVVDMVSPYRTDYLWGLEAASFKPHSDNFVVLYERLADP